MEQTQTLRQEMAVRMIPEQIVASMILRMTAEELREHLQEELESNPALEVRETSAEESAPAIMPEPVWLEAYPPYGARPADDEEYIVDVPAEETLRDYLWAQFRAVSDPGDHAIGRYLIESIDDNGYLSVPLLEVAEDLGESLERIEAVLHQIQELDPPGVGARDLRECLLLQLRAQEWADHPEADIALDILERGWDLLIRRDFDAMPAHLGRSEEQIQMGYAFIRRRLVPYPGQAVRRPWQPCSAPGRLVPDVCIRRTTDGYQVDVTDAGLQASSLCVNREYQLVCRAMQRGGGYSEEERAYVRQALDRARFLLKGLARRAHTLQRVTECLIAEQPEFIAGNTTALRPLTRRELAARIGLSESTVCRATIGKCVQLPHGAIVPFEAFFDVASAIKWRIEAMLKAEDPAAPLKDQEIADRLLEQGIPIARRTVSKYREELGIPGYAERRRQADRAA